MEKKRIAVLGATGSIGRSTAAELAEMKTNFEVELLVGRNNIDELVKQALDLDAKRVLSTDESKYADLRRMAPQNIVVERGGIDRVTELVSGPEIDVVLCAISGIAGAEPVISALRAGKRVALASKEVLVMAGDIVMPIAQSCSGELIPVDSEHSGLFQCLQGRRGDEIAKLVLTGSGGPFLHWSLDRIKQATVVEALKHPTWSMGAKITLDSASLMNKALELIEAHHLFQVPEDKLDVFINPQSVVHALVELADGSFIAQMSVPNMRLAIRYALTYPTRIIGGVPRLSLADVAKLEFFAPDESRFPSLQLAREAMRHGGTMPAVLNAANDVAVARFREGGIPFHGIWTIVEKTIAAFSADRIESLLQLQEIDRSARAFASNVVLN